MTRLAAIDCGTNSIRLLIADASGGQLTDVHREMRIVRLGQGVDATGQFAPEALQRTRVCAGRLRGTVHGPRCRPDPDGRHVGHPRRRQS